MRCDRCKEEIDTATDGLDTQIIKIEAVKVTVGDKHVGSVAGKWTFCQGCWFDVEDELES